MVPQGKIRLAWLGGEHEFCIAQYENLIALEAKCNAGMREIFDRLQTGKYRADDVRETIRLGLIGGGQTPAEALRLVKLYVDGRNWDHSALVALEVLAAALVGVPGDNTVGKGEAERETGSPAPQSTASAQPSDSRQETSTSSRPGNSPPASMGGTKSTATRTQPSRNRSRRPSSTTSSPGTPR